MGGRRRNVSVYSWKACQLPTHTPQGRDAHGHPSLTESPTQQQHPTPACPAPKHQGSGASSTSFGPPFGKELLGLCWSPPNTIIIVQYKDRSVPTPGQVAPSVAGTSHILQRVKKKQILVGRIKTKSTHKSATGGVSCFPHNPFLNMELELWLRKECVSPQRFHRRG